MSTILRKEVPLAPYTVFKIGGTARYFQEAHSKEELIQAVLWAKKYELPFFILGAGSNVLISEKEFPGIVIRPLYSNISIVGNAIHADAGVMMPRAALFAHKQGLEGFEWAVGIPGTIGGSVRGNAGCFGSNIGTSLQSVNVYDAVLKREEKFSHDDCKFGYRESIFKKHPEYIILSAVFSLPSGSPEKIRQTMKEYSMHRVKTQAIGEKCAGCIFKNVPWERVSYEKRKKLLERIPELARFKNDTHLPTALLLDHMGLKRSSIGGAVVSPAHANFFINEKRASFSDVASLISHCKEYVHRKTGILLEEEIHYLA
jgi:UDP-N-acetylmuramate dehydrogenase